jgi:cytochrome P450
LNAAAPFFRSTASPPALTRVIPGAPARNMLQAIRRSLRNPMEGWPAAIYQEDFCSRTALGYKTAFVTSPALVREVLLDKADHFSRTTTLKRGGLKRVLGDGLLTTDGAAWRWQRRIAAPIFRHDRLQAFIPAIQAAAAATAQNLAGRAGQETDIAREMMHTTFAIILQTMLPGGTGIEAAKVEQAVDTLLASVNWNGILAMLGAPDWLPYPGKAQAARARLMLRAMAAGAVDARLLQHSATIQRGDDLLAHLAQAIDPDTGEHMPRGQVLDNILTFILAGHETTALALSWTFYLLSHYPAMAARVRRETEAVTGGAAIAAEHVEALVFTRQVVMEALRLYPPAAAIGRLAERDTALGPYPIEKGSFVIVPIYAIHRHQKLWTAPDQFDPDRFTADRVAARGRYTYIPFAAGPHTCIGMNFAIMEAVIILATILQKIDLKLRPNFDPGLRLRITLRPARGMPMAIHRL